MYRGIIAIATFIIALISWLFLLFYPLIFSFKDKFAIIFNNDKRILIRMCIISASVLIASSTMSLQRTGSYLLMLIPILAIGIFCIEIGFLFTSRFHSFIPLIAGILTVFLGPSIIGFCQIAYEMWDNKVYAGSAGYKELSLAGAHVWFIVMFVILIIVLLIRVFKRKSFMPWLSILGSVIFLVCMSISFYYTVPRSGDEGAIIWVILIPVFILADLALITTIIVGSIVSGVRQIS